MNHPYFMLTLKYKDLKIYLLRDAAGFLKITLYRPLIYHLKSSIARKSQMWWYARGNSGGSWLPEEKKTNMWPGRRNSGGSLPATFPRSSRGPMRGMREGFCGMSFSQNM